MTFSSRNGISGFLTDMASVLSDVEDIVPNLILEVRPDILFQTQEVVESVQNQARDLVPGVIPAAQIYVHC